MSASDGHPGSLRQCLPVAIECIEKNTQDKVKNVDLYNHNRHMLITTAKGLRYWMLFKRRVFKSFGRIFGLDGPGDSVNAEWVSHAMANEIDAFIFVYTEGSVYVAPVIEVRDFALRNNTIRVTDETGEQTMSFPIKMLRRWK